MVRSSTQTAPGEKRSIIDWRRVELANFGQEPICISHSLAGHELFSERALARLLGQLKRGDYYVNTMDVTSHNLRSLREGEISGISGEEVLEAVRTGQIWILLLHPDRIDPAYRDLLNDIYAEMERTIAGFETTLRKMTVLISSPRVQTYYHCDIPGQTLWQVRGEKRVYVYPNHQPFLRQDNLERIALGQVHEISLPYEERFDAQAAVFDLRAGEMMHWPLNAPHRVINGESVSVSFTTEHFTVRDRRRFYVNYANGVLRQRLGFQNLAQKTSGPAYWAKLGVAAAYKYSGGQRKRRKTMRVDFAVDPTAPHGVRTIPLYELRR